MLFYILFGLTRMWKKTFIDDTRDKLFNLRAKVRSYFISNNIPLNNKVYKNLRDLINRQIRFLEDFSFFSFFIRYKYLRKNTHISDGLLEYIDNLFTSNNKKLNKFSSEVRNEAVSIVFWYCIKTSFFLLTIFSILILFFVPIYTFGRFIKNFKLKFISKNEIKSNVSERIIKNNGEYIEEISYYSNEKRLCYTTT